ncbi:MAG: DUF952 domain-containing protein, partial [Actinomycetota bacterium]|nr:DUF952 domain-containing protein [Actinomycetota bacterium]
PESLAADGFVHFSYARQVAATANRFYRDRTELIVIEVEPGRLAEPVVDEDLYGAGDLFPHVYGAIPTSAAVAEHPLPRGPDGDYRFGPGEQ